MAHRAFKLTPARIREASADELDAELRRRGETPESVAKMPRAVQAAMDETYRRRWAGEIARLMEKDD